MCIIVTADLVILVTADIVVTLTVKIFAIPLYLHLITSTQCSEHLEAVGCEVTYLKALLHSVHKLNDIDYIAGTT